MKRVRGRSLVLAMVMLAGGLPWGYGQGDGQSAGEAPPAKQAAEVLRIELVGRIPSVDRGNLQAYWASVRSRTQQQWMQILPREARPPVSTPGEVKIECWVHTDGRVTGMTLEQSSGYAAMDQAAWKAITASAPYDAYPYGISVERAWVRFTFSYNGGTPPPAAGASAPLR